MPTISDEERKAKRKAYLQEYWKKNKDRLQKKHKIWLANNKDRVRAKDRENYQKHREKKIERVMKYYWKNREKILAARRERRKRIKAEKAAQGKKS